MTDDQGPFGKDAPMFGAGDMSAYEASVRRQMVGTPSLRSAKWDLVDESPSDTTQRVTFYHRDSIARIQITTHGGWIDVEPQVEVYAPLSKEEAARGVDEDVNDRLVTDKEFDMLGEAVWFAEYFARNMDDMIPDDPATKLHGPVDVDDDRDDSGRAEGEA